MLEVRGLHAGYGPQKVLHGIDFEVGDGEIVVILGANGAGKTTTMRALSGVITRSGSIKVDGKELVHATPDAIVRSGVVQVPQGRGTFGDLSVSENLDVGGYTRSTSEAKREKERWYEVFPRLAERAGQKAGSLSGGEQQMLAIARAFMAQPKVLLCDEPSLGLAPIITQSLFETLERLNQETGVAILLVEQNADLAMRVASRAYVLETGSIVVSGASADLVDDEAIKKAYLGI